jgi:hypothetical protein
MSKTTVVRTHLLTDRFLIICTKEIGAGGRPRAVVTRTVEEVRRSYTLPTDAGVARGTGTGSVAGWERGTRWSAETVRTIAATALLVLLALLAVPLTVIVAIGCRLPDAEERQQATSSSPSQGLEELAAGGGYRQRTGQVVKVVVVHHSLLLGSSPIGTAGAKTSESSA